MYFLLEVLIRRVGEPQVSGLSYVAMILKLLSLCFNLRISARSKPLPSPDYPTGAARKLGRPQSLCSPNAHSKPPPPPPPCVRKGHPHPPTSRQREPWESFLVLYNQHTLSPHFVFFTPMSLSKVSFSIPCWC